MTQYHLIPLLGIILLVCAGCGNSQFPVAQVEGTITCDGEPVKFVQVNFSPKQASKKDAIVGKSAIGFTDENGKFVLSTYGTNDGAVVGKHEVAVSVTSETDKNCPADISRHTLLQEVDVKNKNNVFTFEIPKRDKKTPLVIPAED